MLACAQLVRERRFAQRLRRAADAGVRIAELLRTHGERVAIVEAEAQIDAASTPARIIRLGPFLRAEVEGPAELHLGVTRSSTTTSASFRSDESSPGSSGPRNVFSDALSGPLAYAICVPMALPPLSPWMSCQPFKTCSCADQ